MCSVACHTGLEKTCFKTNGAKITASQSIMFISVANPFLAEMGALIRSLSCECSFMGFRSVKIHSLLSAPQKFNLEANGFQLSQLSSGVEDWSDPDEVRHICRNCFWGFHQPGLAVKGSSSSWQMLLRFNLQDMHCMFVPNAF